MRIYIYIFYKIKNIKIIILKETYPQSPPVWFSESEDSSILDIVEKLSTTSRNENRVKNNFNIKEFLNINYYHFY